MKRVLLVLLLSCCAAVGFVWRHLPDGRLWIIACDVGQGDATLIIHGYTQLLIDGGRDKKVLRCLGKYMPLGDRKLELVIATHPDADHINGLTTVLSVYEVSTLIRNSDQKETADFAQFQSVVQKRAQKNMRVLAITEQTNFQFGETGEGWVWWLGAKNAVNSRENTGHTETTLSDIKGADAPVMGSVNDRSVITFLRYGEIALLAMGDGEKTTELALLQQGLLLDVDILKVGHHGAKSGTTAQLLQAVTPEIALISAGANNTYGHPHPSVIARLEAAKVRVLRTDTEGDIVLVSDGVSVWRK